MENQEKKVNAKDWKLWVFTVIPIAVFAVALILAVISQFQVDKGNYVPTLAVIAYVLGIMSLGAFLVGGVLKLFRRGGKRNIAAAIIIAVLTFAVCVVLIVFTVTVPKVMKLEIVYNNARSEWIKSSVTDENHAEIEKAYREAKDNFDAVYRPRNRMMQIAQAMLLAGAFTVCLIEEKPKSTDEFCADSKNTIDAVDNDKS